MSIFNFHYAVPPDAVAANYDLNKVIGDNETGFRGTNDAVYRMEGWDFIIAGGGLFNHLDYSFVAGQEDGTFQYPQITARRRRPGTAAAVQDPFRLHPRFRLHQDAARQFRGEVRRADRRFCPGPGRTGPCLRDLHTPCSRRERMEAGGNAWR